MDPAGGDQSILLATVDSVTAEGVTLRLDGQQTPTQKRYKQLSGSLSAGDRVVVARISGSFVVLGKISTG